MGLGFRLNLKWGFPLHSHLHSNSTLKLVSASPVSGKEASFNSARLSFLSVISEESENFSKDPFKPYAFSSSCPQSLEDDLKEMEERKMPAKEDTNGCKASHFSLLMQNLCVLEESFSDSDVLRLEKKILLQLGRLGALTLFNSCLSRTLETSNSLDLSDTITEYIGKNKTSNTMDSHTSRIVVRTSKNEDRKSRKRRLEKPKNLSSQLHSKTIWQGLLQPSVSSVKRSKYPRQKRLALAKKEAEISAGVKMVSKLEQIRAALEKETGGIVSLSCWAEAAGVDEKMLQQNLHFGWRCQDELIRSLCQICQ